MADRSEYRRAYYQANREKALAAAREWKLENPERAKESNRLSAQRMRAKNPERFNETSKRWRENNPEKAKAAYTDWRKRNPFYWWEWRCANLKKWIVDKAKNRAKFAGVLFDLVEDDIVIPEQCPALGIKLDVEAKRTADNSLALDRVIPERGYVRSNVRVISRRANFIKNDATAEELEAIAAYIRRER